MDSVRDAIKLRYRLIPYLYSLTLQSHRDGTPVIRPLVYQFQGDNRTDEISFEYMLGPWLLVASVYEEGSRQRLLYLPSAGQWCNFFTGSWYSGGQDITVAVPLNQPGALFAYEGAVIPTGKNMNFVGESPDDIRIFLLFPPLQDKVFTSTAHILERNEITGEIVVLTVILKSSREEVTVLIETDGAPQLEYDQISFMLPPNDPRTIPKPIFLSSISNQ